MPLSAKALTTVARVQRLPGLSNVDPLVIEDLIEEASERFASEVDREIYYKASHVAWVPGYGDMLLRLRDHVPITSVASIEYNRDAGTTTDTVESTDYTITAMERAGEDIGIIRHLGGGWNWTARTTSDITRDPLPGTEEPAYKVTYAGGWVTPQQDADDGALTRNLPRDIERAVIDHVIAMYYARGRNPAVVSKSTARGSIQHTRGSVSGEMAGLPLGYMDVVAKYIWRAS